VRSAEAESFAAAVAQEYQEATGLTPNVYLCEATDGATVVWPQDSVADASGSS